MRFLHLSDLHLGKRVNEFSMLEDQAYILKEILNIIDEQKVEAVLDRGRHLRQGDSVRRGGEASG